VSALRRLREDVDWHRCQLGAHRVLLDVNSGSLHLLDRVAWEVLDYFDGTNHRQVVEALSGVWPREEVAAVLEELDELRARGQFGVRDRMESSYQGRRDVPVKALCLLVSGQCNLRCEYCFVTEAGPLMRWEVARRSVDFLMQESGTRRLCELDFFGGEPLLNLAVVRATVAYARERARSLGKDVRFSITTNATLVDDEFVALVRQHGISVILSMDGRQAVHDRFRHYRDGRGSWRDALEGALRLLRGVEGLDYWVRGTYTSANLDFSQDVATLVRLGFGRISLEPVVARPEDEYSLKPEHLDTIRGEYRKVAELCLEALREGWELDFYHFRLDPEGGPCLYKRLAGCGAGVDYLAVTPTGELYPCHQFVGRREFRMGTVWEGITNRELRQRFADAHVYRKATCRTCWARFHCGGGCHANNHLLTGDLLWPDALSCDILRARLDCALVVQAARVCGHPHSPGSIRTG